MTQKTLGQWTDRPKDDCDHIIEATARALLVQIQRWDADMTGDHASQTLNNLETVLRDNWEWDGYKLARDLESHHYWECDSELVDILDGAWGHRYDAHQKLVAEWVTGNGIKPQFSVGDSVTVKHKGKSVEGTVVRIDEKHATYTVRCPSLGHVESGTGTHGIVVEFEDVE